MPIYEYQSENPGKPDLSCSVCSKGFELQRPLGRDDLAKCPLCRRPVKKLISRVSTKVVTKEQTDSEAKAAGFHVFNKNCDGGYDKA